MRIQIAMALLFGYIITEVKDFITTGGLENKLAFILLKIIIVLGLMSILIVFPDLNSINMAGYFPKMDENAETPQEKVQPTPRDRSISRTRISSILRRNKFREYLSE